MAFLIHEYTGSVLGLLTLLLAFVVFSIYILSIVLPSVSVCVNVTFFSGSVSPYIFNFGYCVHVEMQLFLCWFCTCYFVALPWFVFWDLFILFVS